MERLANACVSLGAMSLSARWLLLAMLGTVLVPRSIIAVTLRERTAVRRPVAGVRL